MTSPKGAAVAVGRDFILDGHTIGFSDAMQALHENACGWLQTVDGLSSGHETPNDALLSRTEAALVADLGFRGDDVPKARKVLGESSRRQAQPERRNVMAKGGKHETD